MKKFILICIGVFFLCSCTHTYYVTTESDYLDFVRAAHEEIRSLGYAPVYCNCDTTIVRDNEWGGYTWALDKVYTSTYIFRDSIGDTLEFSLAVSYGSANSHDVYIDSAAVRGCRTTKDRDVSFCTGETMDRLRTPPKREVSYRSDAGMVGGLIGTAVVVGSAFFLYGILTNRR